MEVSRVRALRGPNLWSRNTCIEAIVNCSEAEKDVSKISGFEKRLCALFPEIAFLHFYLADSAKSSCECAACRAASRAKRA